MRTEQSIEQQIQDKGLTAPRITPADIDARIAAVQFHRFPGTTVTVCCMSLSNGFNVIGESACASPANFDQEIGEKIARENARAKIWALEGYLLCQNQYNLRAFDRATNGPVEDEAGSDG